jgi:hypothetical protein
VTGWHLDDAPVTAWSARRDTLGLVSGYLRLLDSAVIVGLPLVVSAGVALIRLIKNLVGRLGPPACDADGLVRQHRFPVGTRVRRFAKRGDWGLVPPANSLANLHLSVADSKKASRPRKSCRARHTDRTDRLWADRASANHLSLRRRDPGTDLHRRAG